MRIARQLLFLIVCSSVAGSWCAPSVAIAQLEPVAEGQVAPAQTAAEPAGEVAAASFSATAPVSENAAPIFTADTANLEGCQVIARFDNQIVLACEVLWKVNLMLETHQERLPADRKIKPEEMEEVRRELMKREVAQMVDRKLLYGEFRRNIPPENLPRVEQSLMEPFEQREIPELMKQLKVENQRELEQELARLGSSLDDVRKSFNEKVIAGEWARSKVKINENVSPDEMLEYYQSHLAQYEYPTQARWEELAVDKSRYAHEREAYAAIARLGNEVWQLGKQKQVKGPAFAEVARAKSDGLTAADGGIYDWTTKGALACTAIDEALFRLEVGQMSPILDSGSAYHIVRVLERREAGRKPFTDVQIEIREALKEERMRAQLEVYLTKLRHDARVWTVFTGNIAAEVLMGKVPGETQSR